MKFETVDIFKKANKENRNFKNLTEEELKDLQKQLLLILKDFSSVCQAKNVSFALGGGSALGAVRHNGFIPWDDDVDINMSRSDFERFLDAYNEVLSNSYWLHYPEKRPDLGLGFARLRKKNTLLKTREDLFNEESGVFIDIFFVENTYNNIFMRFLHGLLSLLTGFLLSCRNFYHYRELYLKINGKSFVFKIKTLLGFFLSILPVEKYCSLWNDVNKMCKNNNSKYVVIPVGRKHFFKEMYIRKEIENTIMVKFEDIELPVYESFDSYLKNMYGNYLSIPSDIDKEAHIVLEYGE